MIFDYYLIKVLFISPTRMRASTLNFFNPPDTKLMKLKVDVISAGEMNKKYNFFFYHYENEIPKIAIKSP